MDDKFHEVFNIVFLSDMKVPKDIRLLLMTKEGFVRIYNGSVHWELLGGEEYGRIKRLKYERGNLLDIFAKLEFLVNEIFQIKLLGLYSGEKGLILDSILEYIDLFSRVRLLHELKIINKNLKEKLMEVKKVRNGLAHKWNEAEVNYKGKTLKENFSGFQADMESIWIDLINCYNKEMKKIDLQPIIDQLKKLEAESIVKK